MSATASPADDTSHGGRTLLSLVLSITNAFVGLTAIAYLIGYRVLSSYYSDAGASWATALCSSTQFLSEAAAPIVFVALTALLCYTLLIDSTVKTPKFHVAGACLLAISILCQIIGFAGRYYFLISPGPTYLAATFGGVALAAGAGFYIGNLMAGLHSRMGTWSPEAVWGLYFIIFWGAFAAPGMLGSSRAGVDMNMQLSSLPVVTLTEKTVEEWRLMSAFNDRALIVVLSEEERGQQFRVVGYDQIVEIRPKTGGKKEVGS